MKCYLAHPVTDYGGSERQLRAVSAITSRGWTVESPDQPIHQAAYERRGMRHFLGVVEQCEALAFLRFETGEIGAGVAKEIATALSCRIPVYDATSGYLKPTGVVMPLGVMSVDETRAKLSHLNSQKHPLRIMESSV
jgi:hypothetical protein